jgi:cell division protein FtsW
MLVMFGVSMLNARWIWRLASLVLAGGILLMITVLFTGAEVKGAQRWISILGFSVQPSEFVKTSFIVVSAWLVCLQKERPEFPSYLTCAAIYFLVMTLMLLQPDLGMAIVVTFVLAVQVFLAGLPFRYLIIFGISCIFLMAAAYFSFDHVQSRIDRFLDPSGGDNYQIEKSLAAFRHGGATGTGPGQGSVKNNIPDAHSDFIFAVAGEELGLIFVTIIVAIYLFILLRGYNRLIDNDNIFAVLSAGGLLAMFALQSVVHMGTNVNVLPTKGMTLPFISYGGSSLLSTALAAGFVLALTRRQPRSGIALSGLMTRTRKKTGG